MRQPKRSLAVILALVLAACGSTTQLPVKDESIELGTSVDQLVCQVRAISEAQRLSFHFGTSEQPFGRIATFRLIGDGFEIVLYNPESPHSYVLRAYDVSSDRDGRSRAERAFAVFRNALLHSEPGECAH